MVQKLLFLLLMFSLSTIPVLSQLYKDKTQPMNARVADLLNRMTIEEKFWQVFMVPGDLEQITQNKYQHSLFGLQLGAVAKGDAGGQLINYDVSENSNALVKKANTIQKYFVEKTRLGIPIIFFDEALHGLVRSNATVFPQAIALAASFDTALMHQVSEQIAMETKKIGIRQVLSPVVNIASDVRWGRTEETYGEDPFLSTEMGVAFVAEFEKRGIITTPKHFIANVGDGGRDSYPIHINERLLDEIYLYPFKALIQRGGARSIMTAYNSINGTAASSNKWLLLDKLKKQWGFGGFVISDANAVGGELVLHNTAKNYAESGEHAMNGGLDVIFQTDYEHYKLFIPAFSENKIDTNRLNDAVARVLTAKFQLGLFENPYAPEENDDNDIKAADTIARKAARKSFVLLKNENQLLPVAKKIKTIAVIGTEATEARLGGYSGPGKNKVSILKGIQQQAVSRVNVLYADGCSRTDDEYMTVPVSQLSYNGKPGLQAYYFATPEITNMPAVIRTDNMVDFRWTLYGPDAKLSNHFYAAQWKTIYTSPQTGKIKIGLEGNDGYRLYINDKLMIDRWKKISYSRSVIDYFFEKNKQYSIRIEFYETNGNATIKFIQQNSKATNWNLKIQQAVNVAKKSDMVIAVVGIDEGEFQDRALLSLPSHQEEMIEALSATGKPVTVLIVGGSAVTMSKWKDKVQAIGYVWYPGEQGGHAVADVLFGTYNPAGRLPITLPIHEGQLPLVYNHKPTGRGDDYINLSGQPLFPFGYGLSYTDFSYSNLKISKKEINTHENTTISFTLKNTGARDGEEVVQLYIKDVLASVTRPVMELKGFQRVYVKAGEQKTISFEITPEMLQMLNKEMMLITESGEFSIMIGASSKDIRLKNSIYVKE